LETQFLHTFVAVVDHGSMAAAARVLNITPAAVAQQIRTLEREIGAPRIALERTRELLQETAPAHTTED
jgi:DNA-binding transcriptional LysR family regulator